MKTEMQKSPIGVWVLLTYDSVEAGKKAKELCDRVQQFLGLEYQLHLHPWNMAALQTASFARAAMEAAAWPCVLIVAANGNQPLPQFFKRWISHCLRKPQPAFGIIVGQIYNIPRMKQELTSAYKDLEQIARNTGIVFLSEAVRLPDGVPDISTKKNPRSRVHESVRV